MMGTMVMPLLSEDPPDVEQQQQLISGALPIAGLFILVLGIALFLLWRSMRKQIGRIDESLPSGRDDREQALDRQLTDDAVARGELDESTTPDEPASGSTGS